MIHPIHTFIHRIGRLFLLDHAADPTTNGEIQRNATHIKVYSGGAVRNLSDVGAFAPHALGSANHTTKAHSELTGVGSDDHHPLSHTHLSHSGLGTDDHHPQAHTHDGHVGFGPDNHHPQGHTHLSHSGLGADDHHPQAHTHTIIPETSATADIITLETTTSTAYVDLATAGPAVTLSPGSTQNNLIWISAHFYSSSVSYGAFMSVALSGDPAGDAEAIRSNNTDWETGCRPTYLASVANGSTHTAKYRSENATATASFGRRRIVATTT